MATKQSSKPIEPKSPVVSEAGRHQEPISALPPSLSARRSNLESQKRHARRRSRDVLPCEETLTRRDIPSPSDGQAPVDSQLRTAVSDQPIDHSRVESLGRTVDRLVFLSRVRAQIMQARQRFGNQVGAMDRLRTGEVKGKDGKMAKAKRVPTTDDVAVAMATQGHLLPFVGPLDDMLKAQDKEIAAAAKDLPVWAFVESVRGFGAVGLGLIVGATGDLSSYSNPAKVWKRMGLGLVGNERQRKVTDAEKALLHGYNPRRRSLMHIIGDSLLKQNGRAENPYYRKVYDDRKAYTEAGRPEWTKAHRHMDALRYMEKRLLRHLWQAWKRPAGTFEQPNSALPSDLDAESARSLPPIPLTSQRPANIAVH
jgi:hypothetical protein